MPNGGQVVVRVAADVLDDQTLLSYGLKRKREAYGFKRRFYDATAPLEWEYVQSNRIGSVNACNKKGKASCRVPGGAGGGINQSSRVATS